MTTFTKALHVEPADGNARAVIFEINHDSGAAMVLDIYEGDTPEFIAEHACKMYPDMKAVKVSIATEDAVQCGNHWILVPDALSVAEAAVAHMRARTVEEEMAKEEEDLYRGELWGKITEAALGISPVHTETAARNVGRYVAEKLKMLQGVLSNPRDGMRIGIKDTEFVLAVGEGDSYEELCRHEDFDEFLNLVAEYSDYVEGD